MATRTIQAVVFDLDDTLFPERQYVLSGYRAVGGRLREMLGSVQPFEDWLWARFLRGESSGAFDAINGHFDLHLDTQAIERLVAAYRSHRPAIRPYDGIPEMLGRLHGEFRLGLLSDGFLPAQELKVQALKIERFFDATVFTEALGRSAWKPSTAGFEAIVKSMGVPHQACAYVADNPAKDFLPGNQLGWRTVQYLHPSQLHSQHPAPQGGAPQAIVKDPEGLWRALIA